MIIKSKGYRTKEAIARVIRYVLHEHKLQKSQEAFLLTRFVRNKDKVEKIIGQIEDNEERRIHKRTNVNTIYMDVLSFHKDDRPNLNQEKLKALAREYVLKRCPKSISMVVAHQDTDHIHLHCVFSGLEFATGKAIRISQQKFKSIKVQMEQWQDHRLGLTYSRIDHSKARSMKIENPEDLLLVEDRQQRKQALSHYLNIMLQKSKGFTRWTQQLAQNKIEVYTRNDRIAGIIFRGRKYRLKTLSVNQDRLEQLLENDLKIQKVQERILRLEKTEPELKPKMKQQR